MTYIFECDGFCDDRIETEAEMRVREAEKTTKNPMMVSANCTTMSTQSTLRLGSAGLAPMLPRPESGRRERNDVAIGDYSARRGLVHRPS